MMFVAWLPETGPRGRVRRPSNTNVHHNDYGPLLTNSNNSGDDITTPPVAGELISPRFRTTAENFGFSAEHRLSSSGSGNSV